MTKPNEKRIDWETLFGITYNAQSICGECESASKCRTRNRPPNCPIWESLPDIPKQHEIQDCADTMIRAGWTPKGFTVERWRSVCDAIDNGKVQLSDDQGISLGGGESEGCD